MLFQEPKKCNVGCTRCRTQSYTWLSYPRTLWSALPSPVLSQCKALCDTFAFCGKHLKSKTIGTILKVVAAIKLNSFWDTLFIMKLQKKKWWDYLSLLPQIQKLHIVGSDKTLFLNFWWKWVLVPFCSYQVKILLWNSVKLNLL